MRPRRHERAVAAIEALVEAHSRPDAVRSHDIMTCLLRVVAHVRPSRDQPLVTIHTHTREQSMSEKECLSSTGAGGSPLRAFFGHSPTRE